MIIGGADDEERWKSLLHSGKLGEDIEDMIDLIKAIDPHVGNACHQQYIINPTIDNDYEGIQIKVRQAVAAKRAIRVVIALCTTHTQHVQYWQLLLVQVSSMIQKAAGVLDRFKALSSSDQTVAVNSQQLKIFALSSIRIAEVGLWVAATCLEAASMDTNLATTADKIAHQCSVFVVKALSSWRFPDDEKCALSVLSLNSLAEIAEDHSAYAQACSQHNSPSSATSTIMYCHLTLRPLAVMKESNPIPVPVLDTAHWNERVDCPYLRAAINIFNDISEDPPVCDGPF